MNLPRRSIDSMRRPVNRSASATRSPGVTNFERNSARVMTRPIRCGASVLTTVSTSGSSGIPVHPNAAIDHPNGMRLQTSGIEITSAGAAIELPGVPRTHQRVAMQRTLSKGSTGMGTHS